MEQFVLLANHNQTLCSKGASLDGLVYVQAALHDVLHFEVSEDGRAKNQELKQPFQTSQIRSVFPAFSQQRVIAVQLRCSARQESRRETRNKAHGIDVDKLSEEITML